MRYPRCSPARIPGRPWGMAAGDGASPCTRGSDGRGDESTRSSCAVSRNRRSFLERGALSSLSLGAWCLSGAPADAGARGLVRFPCKEPLLNNYHFLRAGASMLEVEDVLSTNPLFL